MNIQMLTDDEAATLTAGIAGFAEQSDSQGVVSTQCCDGDVEVRAFPRDSNVMDLGPPQDVYIEVTVVDEAAWYEQLSAYSGTNLRDGGPLYEQLADELEVLVEDALGVTSTEFRAVKGSRTFTASPEVDG